MSFPRYPKNKESGVEWLGQVPEHWEVKPLKRNLKLLTEKTDRRDHPVALENIEGWTGRFIPTESEYQGDGVAFEPGDILFGKLRPYLAKAYMAESSGEAVGDFHVMRPQEKIDSRFSQYQILNRRFIDIVDGSTFGSKMPRASWEFVGGMRMAIPPLAEQTAIADFLDRETAKIDGLIAEQERLIELLKEKRQAVISHAVTKGLNPEAPMKDSGIEWLGQVPEHWSVSPLAYRYSVQLGKMLDSSRITGEHLRPYLRVFDVQWGEINTDDLPMMDFDEQDRQKFALKDGDLLVNEGGSYPGRSALWIGQMEECYYQKALHRVRVIDQEHDDGRFLLFLMVWAANYGVFSAGGNEATIEHLPAEKLRRHRFPFPPVQEQRAVVEFLEAETAKSDTLTAEAQKAIIILQERRSALISAAVTGQIDVRGIDQQKAA